MYVVMGDPLQNPDYFSFCTLDPQNPHPIWHFGFLFLCVLNNDRGDLASVEHYIFNQN